MLVKDKFELIYDRSGDMPNIVNLRSSYLKSYSIPKSDINYIKNVALTYAKNKSDLQLYKVLGKNIDECKLINFPQYILPGFLNKEGIPFVNINALSSYGSITEYSPVDIYTLYLYSISLKTFMEKKPFNSDMVEHIASYFFAVFMKIFGKKSGLLGSYKNHIPKLRFLIWIYVAKSMFGEELTEKYKRKTALICGLSDLDSVKQNYNFASTKEFLKSVNENRIIPLSENIFSSRMISLGGTNSLPLFEDVSRLFSTFICADVTGNSIFSSYWIKVRTDLFKKLVYLGTKSLIIHSK